MIADVIITAPDVATIAKIAAAAAVVSWAVVQGGKLALAHLEEAKIPTFWWNWALRGGSVFVGAVVGLSLERTVWGFYIGFGAGMFNSMIILIVKRMISAYMPAPAPAPGAPPADPPV